jgi:hypothetical protein
MVLVHIILLIDNLFALFFSCNFIALLCLLAAETQKKEVPPAPEAGE